MVNRIHHGLPISDMLSKEKAATQSGLHCCQYADHDEFTPATGMVRWSLTAHVHTNQLRWLERQTPQYRGL